jgi:hypothetical protein
VREDNPAQASTTVCNDVCPFGLALRHGALPIITEFKDISDEESSGPCCEWYRPPFGGRWECIFLCPM